MSSHRWSFALSATLAAACAGAPEPGVDIQALTMSEFLVSLRTSDQHFLTAELDGGGAISTDRSGVGPWERWWLSDLNGPPFESGDAVQIRHVSSEGTSYWWVADVNGGGPGSLLRADRTVPGAWETFIIEKPGGGAIAGGDKVNFKSSTQPYYVCAEQGGGQIGDGALRVDRSQAQTWESFTLSQITPFELCPFSGSLCLFDGANFSGERFTVQASDHEQGACIDLVEHGWGGRARSAVNLNSKSASLLPNADCTGHPIGIAPDAAEPTLPLLPDGAFVF
jgi:hypothetical protein